MIKDSTQDNRIIWVDILRIIATWGVISIHGKSCYDFEITSYKWVEFNVIGQVFTFCVPAFLMLSGMLILQREPSIKETVLKRVPKVYLMKLVSLFFCVLVGVAIALLHKAPLRDCVVSVVEPGRWGMGTSYLSVLAGCYIVSPFLYKIIYDEKMEEYFLILAMIFCWIVPSFVDLPYVQESVPEFISAAMGWIDYGQVYVPVGSAMLFVMGHYLDRIAYKISKRRATLLVIIGLFAWVLSGLWAIANPDVKNLITILRYGRYYGSYVAPLITFYTAAIFIFFKNVVADIRFSERTERWIRHLGRNSIMIFLLHGIVINVFRPRIPIFWTRSFLLETVVDVTFYFIVCYIASLILEHIPIIRRIM